MPIYAYRCESCGFAKDVLQKVSDPLLTVCLSCGAATFKKQLTAAGFQLKGSGWYVTDFKGDAKAAKGPGESTNGDAGQGDASKSEPGKTDTAAAKPAEPAAAVSVAKADKVSAPASAAGGTSSPAGGE